MIGQGFDGVDDWLFLCELRKKKGRGTDLHWSIMQVSDKMNPNELVKLIEILNPQNKAGRITVIARMGAENMRVKLPHLIRAVRQAGQIVTWVSDPMHGNTIKAPCGLKTRPFDSILVLFSSCYFLLF